MHKASTARFINKDVEHWPTVVHDAALSAKSNRHETPGIGELTGTAVLTWAHLNAYIDFGGPKHTDIHKKPVAHREKGKRAVKRAHRDEDSAQFPCFRWASRRRCRLERKEDPCKNRHEPADKFREQKEGGRGTSGAEQKKPKAGVCTVPSAFASEEGDGIGQGGSSAKSSNCDDQ